MVGNGTMDLGFQGGCTLVSWGFLVSLLGCRLVSVCLLSVWVDLVLVFFVWSCMGVCGWIFLTGRREMGVTHTPATAVTARKTD